MLRTLAMIAAAAAAFQDFSANSYLGKAPPELTGEASQWINSKAPVRLSDLKGKVVWLEFGFLN
jgi:hypothetical protein